jgi:hypothetical protein
MMLAVTASMLTDVGSGGRFAASFLFSSNDMAEPPLRKRPEWKWATNTRFRRMRKARQFPHFRLHTLTGWLATRRSVDGIAVAAETLRLSPYEA